MPDTDHASTVRFSHQLFHGTTWHSRLLPSVHKFTYPYRYWGVNITSLAAGQALPEVGGEVTTNRKLFDKLPIPTSALNKLLAKVYHSFQLATKRYSSSMLMTICKRMIYKGMIYKS